MSDGKQQAVTISMNDISNCLNIIDIVTQRGAFKGQELSSIGALRDRFALFIEQNKEPSENIVPNE
jgi:hypothetical protein